MAKPMQNKKTTIAGYLTIAVAVFGVAISYLNGETPDLNTIIVALGIGGAGIGAVNASDGGR